MDQKKPESALVFPVRPFTLENSVGLGVFLGFIYHAIANWNKVFPPATSDIMNFALMAIHIGTFSLIIGTFMYQLIFWVFRCYNRKLIKRIQYQVALERCLQLLFGLCLGGYLLYRWKKMNELAACIPKEYCPDSYFNNNVLMLKKETCGKDGKICKEFFDRVPGFFQTFRTVGFGIFLQLMFERQNQLQISMTVYKTA